MAVTVNSFTVLKIFNYKKEQEVRVLRSFTNKEKAIDYINLLANEHTTNMKNYI